MRYFIFGVVLIIALAAFTSCSASPERQLQLEHAAEAVTAGIGAYNGLETTATSPDLAPAYARLARLRHNAATALDNHAISLQTAVTIQNVGDSVRSLLDQARSYDAANNTAAATANLDAAITQITRLEGLLP